MAVVRLFALLLILFPVAAFAQSLGGERPYIDENYQVPDHSAQMEVILDRAQQILAIRDAMKAHKKLTEERARQSLAEAVKDMYVPTSLQDINSQYGEEISLAVNSKNVYIWERLARKYRGQGRLDEALGAAFGQYQRALSDNHKSDALQNMAEIYLARDENQDALNLYHLAVKASKGTRYTSNYQRLRERFFLLIRDVNVDAEQDVPRACINFSQDLQKELHPEDYVSLEGETDLDISVSKNQICLRGLSHGQSYTLLVKSGVPAANGLKLEEESKRSIRVPDRAQRVTFETASYVLGNSHNNLVPVTTVNMDSLSLELYMIHDRNLVNGLERGFTQDLNYYLTNEIRDDTGRKVWQGTVDIDNVKNREVKTLIPLNDILEREAKGVYILTAKRKSTGYRSQPEATQWLLVSDLGLTGFKGADGLHVFIRSLETAKPQSKVTVNLLARNNRILATAKTNSKGYARFPREAALGQGGDRPVMITAGRGDEDFTFLRLTSALDLSERGVEGRDTPDHYDAYLYTDRGVYRPGESVKLSALLRDLDAKAVGNSPLTFEVWTPDDTQLLATTLTGDELGGYALDIPLSAIARTGEYRVTVYLTDQLDSLGEATFQVEDFVPQRIRARMTSDDDMLEVGKAVSLDLQADFLYGAPAADLMTTTEPMIVPNNRPFEKFAAYKFGRHDDGFHRKELPPVEGNTDEDGKVKVSLTLDKLPETSLPLQVVFGAEVQDVGGRAVTAGYVLPVQGREVQVGLKSLITGTLSTGDKAAYEIVAVSRDGEPVAGRKVNYRIIREDYYYSWYMSSGYWRSRRSITEEIVASGDLLTGEDGRIKLEQELQDGRYRIEVADTDGSSEASLPFYVGWWRGSGQPDEPDQMEIVLKEDDVADGDKLTAFIRAPFAGRAMINVVSHKLLKTMEVELPEEGREVSLKVDKAWGPGAYLMVTAYRPDGGEVTLLPFRTMGLKWFSINREKRQANVELEVPEYAQPRQKITLPVKLSGADVSGKKVLLTIAAVDEGILQLTKFNSPQPENYFLGKRSLGLSIHDLYGRLIKAVDGVEGKLRTGGGVELAPEPFLEQVVVTARKRSDNEAGVQTKTSRTVALYTREVSLNKEGEGEVTLDLPDFAGRLRLMAVAYGEEVIGSGEEQLVVRDPVVASMILPRFLAPGDMTETSLSVHNLSGSDKTLKVSMSVDGVVTAQGFTGGEMKLADRERHEETVLLTAPDAGISTITLTVEGDGFRPIKRSWQIESRASQPYTSERTIGLIGPGQTYTVRDDILSPYYDATASLMLTVTDRPDFDVPALLDSLYMYPYGCGEQTTSKALPLLYYGNLAETWHKAYNPQKLRRNLDVSIQRLIDMQTEDGAFGVWNAWGDPHPWLTAYIFEYLSRAREQGLHVPDAAYEHAMEWLKDFAGDRVDDDETHMKAYALYVLARIGKVTASEVRYAADHYADKMPTRLGLGHLAAALAIVGERDKAEKLFIEAIGRRRDREKYYKDYGSDIRDNAALLVLMLENMPGQELKLKLVDMLENQFSNRRYFSTQEKAWLVVATYHLTRGKLGEGFTVTLNSQSFDERSEPLRLQLLPKHLERGVTLKNEEETPLRLIQSTRGVHRTPLPAEANGMEIRRQFFTSDGRPADLENVRQNDLLTVVIDVRLDGSRTYEGLIVDLLPAGFEIETQALGGAEGVELKDVVEGGRYSDNFEFEDDRDDRYVAAFDGGGYFRRDRFVASYVVRAVTPGSYTVPAPYVEDMYKPQFFARGEMGKLVIRRRGE